MTRVLATLLLAIPLVAAAAPRDHLGFDPVKAPDAVSAAYFAPENQILFRMRNPDGSYREFQRNFDKPNALWSVMGWRGTIKGDKVRITSGPKLEGGPAKYVFDRGRLVSFEQGENKRAYAYDSPRLPTDGGVPYVFGDEAQQQKNADRDKKSATDGKKSKKAQPKGLSREVLKEFAKKWKSSGRLCVPFPNPNINGFFFASLAILATFLFFFRNKWVKIAGGAFFFLACGAMVMAASRGAFLAFACGLAPMMWLNRKVLLKSRAAWALAGLVLLAAVGWFATHESRLITRGFSKQSRWSNDLRLEMWGTAPQMIAEAPNGWGTMHVGRAYMDWYQGLDEISLPGSLMNEHLTRLVGYSRVGRFTYVFAWLACLLLTGWSAMRTKRASAFGMGIALAVAGWFNPVYENALVLVVPAVAGACWLFERPWCTWRPARWLGAAMGAAVLLAVVLVAGISIVGSTKKPTRGYPITVADGRVYVKGMNPQTWIVDDGKALGGVLACKDIRGYYAYDNTAPAVGYVRRVEDLPAGKVHRLVLAGETGSAWLEKVFGNVVNEVAIRVTKGGKEYLDETKFVEELRRALPDEVVFITPNFVPSAVPEGLSVVSKTSIVIGEFTARYEPEYATPPPWVKIVPAMELYINGWMQYALGVK
jgi:hypothetical protein